MIISPAGSHPGLCLGACVGPVRLDSLRESTPLRVRARTRSLYLANAPRSTPPTVIYCLRFDVSQLVLSHALAVMRDKYVCQSNRHRSLVIAEPVERISLMFPRVVPPLLSSLHILFCARTLHSRTEHILYSSRLPSAKAPASPLKNDPQARRLKPLGYPVSYNEAFSSVCPPINDTTTLFNVQ